MIFADTSFFVALFRNQDAFHAIAAELSAVMKSDEETLVTTEHVLSEVLTFIKTRDGMSRAVESWRQISDAGRISVLFSNADAFERAIEIFGKYEKFSFCDALSVATMQEIGAKKIVSFDSDFDLVKGIERVY